MTGGQSQIEIRAVDLLVQAGDPDRAASMAAYMRTDMPFYGVASPERKRISRIVGTEFPATTRIEYVRCVRALWGGSHREEKYLGIAYARSYPRFVTLSSLPLYRMMIVQGAWWDFVDEIASHLVGAVLLGQRDRATPELRSWSTGDDMWMVRASIISQLRHKEETDTALLEAVCTANLGDGKFFIRKAIGWALREYAKSDPAWVLEYVAAHEHEMSGLSYREAVKHLRI